MTVPGFVPASLVAPPELPAPELPVPPLDPELLDPLDDEAPPPDAPPEAPPLPLLLPPLLPVPPLLPKPPPSSPGTSGPLHVVNENPTLVVPPSSSVAGPPPPPSSLQTPASPGHAFPRSAGEQYGAPRNSHTAHARLTPVPVEPPELLLPPLLPPLLLPPPVPPASYAQPFGSSQHVASMHLPPVCPHAWPI